MTYGKKTNYIAEIKLCSPLFMQLDQENKAFTLSIRKTKTLLDLSVLVDFWGVGKILQSLTM